MNFLYVLTKEQLFYSYWPDQYVYICIYIFISLFISAVLFIVAFILSVKDTTFEKISPYECGFESYGDAHSIFNVQFFVVSILFMLFDLELAYIFPWAVNLGNLGIFSFLVMFFFLILLTIGFIYEWKKGALDWL